MRIFRTRQAPLEEAAQPEPGTVSATAPSDPWSLLGPIVLLVVTLAFYWRPLTSAETSIRWDAADQFHPFQRYFSEELHQGKLPFWTPYLTSGFPFLADPQVGAWYPLNWPFFLLGVPPRALVAESFLHALLACLGTFLLTRRLTGSAPAGALAGLCFGLSGFFSGHNSHTPMLQSAAWTPWLLLAFDRALENRSVRNAALGGLAAGATILCGHFQTALYAFLALTLFAAARVARTPRSWRRALALALAIPLLGTLLSAVGSAPGLELAFASTRASIDALTRSETRLSLRALATLVDPNHFGVISPPGGYHGPWDSTQHYYYAGLALLPLAILGLRHRVSRWTGILLIVAPIWYALGPPAGLYLLIARLPGFASVRYPVHVWFVPALGLALLAGAGLAAALRRWPSKWLAPAVVLLTAADVCYWNSFVNPLVYSRSSYEKLYGAKEEEFRRRIAATLPPQTRFDAPRNVTVFGPLGHPLTARAETTYGYLAMPVARYDDYFQAMQANAKLRDGLSVAQWFDKPNRTIRPNPSALPRANFPKRLVGVASSIESRALLATLDPAEAALIPDRIQVAAQDAAGRAELVDRAAGSYSVRFRCVSPSVLRVANAWFDGWTATLDGRPLELFPVDHALTGVLVPAGEGVVELRYRSTYFFAGAVVSSLALLVCLSLVLFGDRALIRSAPAGNAGLPIER